MAKKKNEKKLRKQVEKEVSLAADLRCVGNDVPDNPDLVDELIDGLWTMDEEEFDQKYSSLNKSDMFKVASATIAVSPFLEDDIFEGSKQLWWEDEEDYEDDDDWYDDDFDYSDSEYADSEYDEDYDEYDNEDYEDYDDEDYDEYDEYDDEINYEDACRVSETGEENVLELDESELPF